MMRWIGLACLMLVVMQENVAGGDAALANGARAVWDLDKAHREKTPTREQICINGLWRWQPARNAKGLATLSNPLENDTAVPADRWGYFKVPGCWPGAADYQQKDSQSILPDQSWSSENLRGLSTAWYQREITIPQDWTGRRISLSVETLNSLATIYIDGKLAGDGKNANIYFPGGELDITASCKPGQKHVLTALVFALPMGGVRYSYADSAAPKLIDTKATPLLRRGFCGDVFLVGTPSGARVADVKIGTSWRNGEITVDAALQGLDSTGQYTLRAVVSDGGRTVKEISSRKFAAADLVDGRFAVVEKWKAEKLWDTHTPQNMYHLQLTLQDAGGKALDVALPVRFGYREMWIEGRDFYLNGSRIFLSGIAMANSQVGAAAATYETTRETIARMQAYGINFVYTGPFNCSPGAHLSYGEILRAADDMGLLIAFTQPHMGGYEVDWAKPAEQDAQSDYARHAAAYVRTAQNHPSVVCYSMNHNAGGYAEDMCPSKIDGKYQRAGSRSPDKLLRAEAIVKRLDSTRIIYHHAGGNLGTMHTSNFYPNFTPIQELSDWFQHWSAEGVKPLYTNEYGGPFGWDWTMYRGWYKDKRTFGSAVVPWEFCIAEWNSQFLGDRAFQISENEKSILRWEAKQCADKAKLEKGWYRWDYPVVPGSSKLAETNFVTAMYFTDNFRAYRTLGVSAISPWEFHRFWDLRDNANREQKNFQVDWDNLQRPGFSPDFVKDRYENYVFAYERADWVPSAAAEALKRNNMPLLAYIGGKTAQVTSKDHNFVPGEAVEKQLIVINNSRTTVSAECSWSLALPQALSGVKAVSVKTGEQERIPLRFDLPASVAAGSYALTATVRFGSGETQTDTFTIHVVPAPQPAKSGGKIALFDPKGETTAWLKTEGIACQSVAATADLAPFDTLIIGKAALTVDGPGPDVLHGNEGQNGSFEF